MFRNISTVDSYCGEIIGSVFKTILISPRPISDQIFIFAAIFSDTTAFANVLQKPKLPLSQRAQAMRFKIWHFILCTLTGSNIISSSTSSKADDDHPIPRLATSDTLLGTLNGRPGRDTPLNDHDFGFPHRFFAGPFSKNVTFTSPNATLPVESNTKTSVKQMTSKRSSKFSVVLH